MVDAGSGTLANLQRHIAWEQLDAIVLSHEHPDHWGDLEGWHIVWRYRLGRSDFPVYAPAGLREHTYEPESPAFAWHEVTDGDTVAVGTMTFTFSRTDHGPETLAMRVDAGGRSLGYSADTGPGWSLEALGPGLDLALCEATMPIEEENTLDHLSAATGRSVGPRRRRRPPGPDPLLVVAGPGRGAPAGVGGLRGPGRGGVARGPVRGMRRDGRQPDDLRPLTFVRDYTEMAAGSVLVYDGQDPRALHRVGRRAGPPVDAGEGHGLGDRRVLDAARLHPGAQQPRGQQGQAVGAHPGDPAPDRALAPIGVRHGPDGRAPDPRRLRRPPGRRRHPHRVDQRGLRRPPRRLHPPGGGRASCRPSR